MPSTYIWTRLDVESSDLNGLTGVITHMVCGLTVRDELTGRKYYMDSRRELMPPDADDFTPLDEITVEWKESAAESLTEELGFRDRMDLTMAKFVGKPRYDKDYTIPVDPTYYWDEDSSSWISEDEEAARLEREEND